MLLQLGHMKYTVQLPDPAPKVKPIYCLPYALYYPERSNKPSSELPSACQVESLRREQNFFSYQMLLQPVVLVKVMLLVGLCLLQVILGVLD